MFYLCLPNPLFNKPFSTVLFDNKNELLSVRIASDAQWRFPAHDRNSEKFKVCLINFEDKYFYRHFGVNPVSVFKAFINNFKNERRNGGSTLTMQLARLVYGNVNRTYLQKFKEVVLAIRIEFSFSKDEIMELYALHAPFGGNIVGIHTASWRYFKRPLSNLSWGETALLAVLPNAPSLIYPGKNHHLLLKKRDGLLKQLFLSKKIDETTYQLAIAEKLPFKPSSFPDLTPHLLLKAVKESGDGKVHTTTIDKNVQNTTSLILNKEIANLRGNEINNSCALIIETKSGNVLAYVGNVNHPKKIDQNDVDLISSNRSSGSILKPFLYAFLIDEGKLAPKALVEDIPMQIGSYAPKNYNLTYDGLVRANEALTRSLNIPAVKLLQSYGSSLFIYKLKSFGFKSINKSAAHYGLSLILGGAEVSPWEVGLTYSYLGRVLLNYSSKKFSSTQTELGLNYRVDSLKRNSSTKVSDLLSAGAIWSTFNSITELARPEGYTEKNLFSSVQKIAWKTGTSFGYRDAWAVGVTPKYTIVVWVGNADGEGRPGLTGINVAAPIMFSVFNSLPKSAWFSEPVKNLISVKTCAESGYRFSDDCLNAITINAPIKTNQSPICTYHKKLLLDSSGMYLVNSQCYPRAKAIQKTFLVLNPLQEYYYKQNHLDFVSRPPFLPQCFNESTDKTFDIIYPRNGYKIYLPKNELNQRNELILKATHHLSNSKLFWYLDETFIDATQNYHQLAILPVKGEHRLVLIDEHGKSLSIKFEVVNE